jgi:hypothetical protein
VVGRLERAILRIDFIVPVKIEFPEFGRRSVVHRLWRVKIVFPEFGRRSLYRRALAESPRPRTLGRSRVRGESLSRRRVSLCATA